MNKNTGSIENDIKSKENNKESTEYNKPNIDVQVRELLDVLDMADSYDKFCKLAVLNPNDYRSWNFFKRQLLEMITNTKDIDQYIAGNILLQYKNNLLNTLSYNDSEDRLKLDPANLEEQKTVLNNPINYTSNKASIESTNQAPIQVSSSDQKNTAIETGQIALDRTFIDKLPKSSISTDQSILSRQRIVSSIKNTLRSTASFLDRALIQKLPNGSVSTDESTTSIQKIVSSIKNTLRSTASFLFMQDNYPEEDRSKRVKLSDDIGQRWYEDIAETDKVKEYMPKDIESFIKNQLLLTQEALCVDPKSYATWHHRAQMFELYKKEWFKEHQLCNLLFQIDQRNFHCWNYCLINNFKVAFDIENYSSYNYNLKKYRESNINIDILKRYVEKALFLDPSQISTWSLYESIIDSEDCIGILKYFDSSIEIVFNRMFQGTIEFIEADSLDTNKKSKKGKSKSKSDDKSHNCTSHSENHGKTSVVAIREIDKECDKNKTDILRISVKQLQCSAKNNNDSNAISNNDSLLIRSEAVYIHIDSNSTIKKKQIEKESLIELPNRPVDIVIEEEDSYNTNKNSVNNLGNAYRLNKHSIFYIHPTKKANVVGVDRSKYKTVKVNNKIHQLVRQDIPKVVEEILGLDPTCLMALKLKLKYTTDLLERQEIINILIDIDPIRKNYYNSLLSKSNVYFKIK